MVVVVVVLKRLEHTSVRPAMCTDASNSGSDVPVDMIPPALNQRTRPKKIYPRLRREHGESPLEIPKSTFMWKRKDNFQCSLKTDQVRVRHGHSSFRIILRTNLAGWDEDGLL